MCLVTIVAKENVARVIFEGTNLGILLPDYIMGQPYTIEQGRNVTIAIFNGNAKGTLEYDVSFSRATQLIASAFTLIAALASIGY